MSRYSQESELTKLNNTGYSRHRELIRVITECKRWGELTDGAFDVTITPFFKLWDFERRRIPEEEDLRDVSHLVDYRKIGVSDSLLQIREGMEIDLGGAAKGYAVDRAVEKLKNLGIQHALVDAGGDIKALGGRGEEPWKIGVKHPRRNGILRLIELRDGSVATSGDYEKYFLREGVRYHHILDPRTGYPAEGCVSVTILAETAMEADILATGVMVLGTDAGAGLIESLEGVGALIVSERAEGLVADEVGILGNERGEILQD
jgi:thiamine biosynthesis lipoprotein